MTAGLCRCGPADVRAVSPDHCACGGAFYREAIAPEPRSAVDAAQDASEAPLGMPEPAWGPPGPKDQVWRGNKIAVRRSGFGGHEPVWWDAAMVTWAESEQPESREEILAAFLAERVRANRAEAALAAFQRASGCADGPTLAVVLRERNALLRDLRDVGTMATPHRFVGECPDVERDGVSSAEDRDPDCDACAVLVRADAALVGSRRGDA